jgi:hypothetical protein
MTATFLNEWLSASEVGVSFTTKWRVAKYYLRNECFLSFSRNPRSFKEIEGSLLCYLFWASLIQLKHFYPGF